MAAGLRTSPMVLEHLSLDISAQTGITEAVVGWLCSSEGRTVIVAVLLFWKGALHQRCSP